MKTFFTRGLPLLLAMVLIAVAEKPSYAQWDPISMTTMINVVRSGEVVIQGIPRNINHAVHGAHLFRLVTLAQNELTTVAGRTVPTQAGYERIVRVLRETVSRPKALHDTFGLGAKSLSVLESMRRQMALLRSVSNSLVRFGQSNGLSCMGAIAVFAGRDLIPMLIPNAVAALRAKDSYAEYLRSAIGIINRDREYARQIVASDCRQCFQKIMDYWGRQGRARTRIHLYTNDGDLPEEFRDMPQLVAAILTQFELYVRGRLNTCSGLAGGRTAKGGGVVLSFAIAGNSNSVPAVTDICE